MDLLGQGRRLGGVVGRSGGRAGQPRLDSCPESQVDLLFKLPREDSSAVYCRCRATFLAASRTSQLSIWSLSESISFFRPVITAVTAVVCLSVRVRTLLPNAMPASWTFDGLSLYALVNAASSND